MKSEKIGNGFCLFEKKKKSPKPTNPQTQLYQHNKRRNHTLMTSLMRLSSHAAINDEFGSDIE